MNKKWGVFLNKRQKKKNEKKYLPIIADEFNLLTMAKEEQEKAWRIFLKYREKHAFFKKYKDLKKAKDKKGKKMLIYAFPMGEKVGNYLKDIHQVSRKKSSTVKITQKF